MSAFDSPQVIGYHFAAAGLFSSISYIEYLRASREISAVILAYKASKATLQVLIISDCFKTALRLREDCVKTA